MFDDKFFKSREISSSFPSTVIKTLLILAQSYTLSLRDIESEPFRRISFDFLDSGSNSGTAGERYALVFEDESFDLVIFTEVIEHLPPVSVPEILQGIAKKIKKGGKLLISSIVESTPSWVQPAMRC